MLRLAVWCAWLHHRWRRVIGVTHTKGFDPNELATHWKKHRADFGGCSMKDYQDLADAFLGAARPAGVLECRRPNTASGAAGDSLRLNCVTEEFGVLSRATGYIITYFKPAPLKKHKHTTNAAYFCDECQRNF